MDQFDFIFALDGVSTLSSQSPDCSPAGSPVVTPVVPVLPDTPDVMEFSIDDIPMDYDHRSSGFAAYCIIASTPSQG
ncbi:hypothetical protein C8T65DRAFT_744227 [Cerioporus squamosus]|nr:hypothetical protein C8T65DRAFT_744227 [Cerioporus squamosus]